MKKLNIFVIGVLLFSMLGMPLLNAQIAEKYQQAKKNYLNAVKVYNEARKDFITAKNKYKQYKRAENRELAFEKAKDFLLKADRAMIRYLKMLRVRVEFARGITEEERQRTLEKIDSYITWLEEKQPEIESANSPKELKEIARQVSDEWKEIRVEAKRIVGKILCYKIDNIISKAEAISEKLSDRIQELKEEGKDTSELEALLSDFNEKIALAKEKNELAREKFKEVSSIKEMDKLFREGHAFIKEANKYLRDAYKDLKEIHRKLKTYRTGETTKTGEGMLTAEGSGVVKVFGNGSLEVSGEGNLTVIDYGGDAEEKVEGYGNKIDYGNSTIFYQGFGSAEISGSNVTVIIEGKNLKLEAKGRGTVFLNGTGTYKTKKGLEGDWTASEVQYGGEQ